MLSLKKNCLYTALILALASTILCAEKEESPAKRQKGLLGIQLNGNKIIKVVQASAALEAGLKKGDIITSLDGTKIVSLQDMKKAMAGKFANDIIAVQFIRAGQEMSTSVKLKAPQKRPYGGLVPPQVKGPKSYIRKTQALNKEASLQAGLKWLAAQQLPDGSFPASSIFGAEKRFTLAVTSLAGLALMLSPEYKTQYEKTMAFILKCCQENGLIVYKKHASFKTIWEHAFATQFLGEALLSQSSLKQKSSNYTQILSCFKKAIALIKNSQNLEGGWGYRPFPDPHAEVGPAAALLDALALAVKMGIAVEEDLIVKAMQSQTVLLLKPGLKTVQGEWRSYSYEAHAFVLSSLLGWNKHPEIEAYYKLIKKVPVEVYFKNFTEKSFARNIYWATGFHTLGLYYSGLAFKRLGHEHSDSFSQWHKKVITHLGKIQNKKGNWMGWFGDVYGTAFSCLTIALDKNKLALFNPMPVNPQEKKNLARSPLIKMTIMQKQDFVLDYKISKSKTKDSWSGLNNTIKKVGLNQKKVTYKAVDLQKLLPEKEVHVGSSWLIPADVAARFFKPFHTECRAIFKAKLSNLNQGIAEIQLRSLVKLGNISNKHLLTTAMRGKILLDTIKREINFLELSTVRGCIFVKLSRGGYVGLNDICLSVKGIKGMQ